MTELAMTELLLIKVTSNVVLHVIGLVLVDHGDGELCAARLILGSERPSDTDPRRNL
ncbi:hypothetical protein [Ilumatobacter sp.]|uniref:hypothetical protein n=1 Tax=Ilumatobacter sp. TaxID=1967498 RepID=UPI003753A0CB